MSRTTPPSRRPTARMRGHRAFTLVELMVVTVVIAVLASLVLAGLAAARGRAKADRTRSTIRKIHEIIVPHYETYARRRVALPSTGNNAPVANEARWQLARKFLRERRLLCAREMPDRWDDVTLTPASNVTGPVRAYVAHASGATAALQDAECLAMIVLRGGVPPEEAEHFRADEIGDFDRDGKVEFWDGWARPIRYIRWQSSFILSGTSDPMDPLRVSGAGTPPSNTPDPALLPLIVSHGAEAPATLATMTSIGSNSSWVTVLTGAITAGNTTQTFPLNLGTGNDMADDISNFRLWER